MVKRNSKSKKRDKSKIVAKQTKISVYRHIASIGIAIFAFVYLYVLYIASNVNPITRIIFGIASLILIGMLISRLESLEGSYGIYLIGGKRGINTINTLAKKNKKLWKAMAEWGIILGFGLLSLRILGKETSKKAYIFGLISIIVTVLFIVPFTSYGLQFIKLQQFAALGYTGGLSIFSNMSTVQALFIAITVVITFIFGLSGYIFFALLLGSYTVLVSVAKIISRALTGVISVAPLSHNIPGVLPVIPGLTIPLISGLVAFVIIIVIHEFSHGILSVIAKVKIKKVGLLVFGVIPLGAFVEPDEKKITKLNKMAQNRIYAAGVAANFVAMFVFLILLLAVLPYINNNILKVVVVGTTPGYSAYNVIMPGSEILFWNNHKVTNLASLGIASSTDTPGSKVNIITNKGSYSFIAKAAQGTSRGLIGVSLSEKPVINNFFGSIMYFLYSVFALTLMLNFLIGVINLLPLPILDGWRIYKTTIIKRVWIINALTVLVIAILIIISLPWLGGL